MNITKLFKRTSAAAAAGAMAAALAAMPFTASAENTAVQEARSGILAVETIYQPTGEDALTVSTGTGFLINENTFITCQHCVSVTPEDEEVIESIYTELTGEEHKYDSDYLKFQIAVLGDIKEPASIVKASPEGDFAILEFQTKLTTKTPLTLGNSDEVKQTEQIYALGFPYQVDNQMHVDYAGFADDDVTITDGIVQKTKYIFPESSSYLGTGSKLTSKFIEHSASLSPGNSGGPLLNSKGEVIGVNAGTADGFFYATEINQITAILDAYGTEYNSGSGNPTPDPDPEEDSEPEEPIPTLAPQTDPIPVPTEPAPEPEPESGVNWILIGGLIAAAVVVIVIIIVLVLKSTKKPEPAPAPTPARPPVNPSAPPRPSAPPVPPSFGGGIDAGAGETSLLNSGAGETSVLGGGAGGAARATLYRVKSGTSIPINAPEFIIGKENSRVNYCVNNNAVSRQHAKITVQAGSYFITDMNSSNYTYINGRQIAANTPQMLHSGDKIKLADEEFEFRG